MPWRYTSHFSPLIARMQLLKIKRTFLTNYCRMCKIIFWEGHQSYIMASQQDHFRCCFLHREDHKILCRTCQLTSGWPPSLNISMNLPVRGSLGIIIKHWQHATLPGLEAGWVNKRWFVQMKLETIIKWRVIRERQEELLAGGCALH